MCTGPMFLPATFLRRSPSIRSPAAPGATVTYGGQVTMQAPDGTWVPSPYTPVNSNSLGGQCGTLSENGNFTDADGRFSSVPSVQVRPGAIFYLATNDDSGLSGWSGNSRRAGADPIVGRSDRSHVHERTDRAATAHRKPQLQCARRISGHSRSTGKTMQAHRPPGCTCSLADPRTGS